MRKSTLNGIAFSMKSLFFVSGSVSANSIAIAKEFSAEHWVLVFTTSTALSLIVFVALAWLVVRVRSLEQEQARKFDWDCFKLESALVPFLILAPFS